MMRRTLITIGFLTGAMGCSLAKDVGDRPIPAKNEIVISPETRITATTSLGTIAITAGKGLKRSFTWEGATRSVEMMPRKDRWLGSLGLYYPAPGHHWKEHNGIACCVAEEGQQNFKSEEEALKWIEETKFGTWVWRSDGLVVGWYKIPESKMLGVNVWQILINGEKPSKLPGAQDDKIAVDKVTEEEKK